MITSIQSFSATQPTISPITVDARTPVVDRVAETENLKPAPDVVEFKEAGSVAQIIVAVRTQFNESKRLVDIIA